MANGGDRVLRITGEGHQRLRNDHEQFLEAYEKPTQIYKLLQARNSLKPLYLQRNLSYMPRHARKTNRRYKRKFSSKADFQLNHSLQPSKKVDLASEVKSDSRLEISFCCLDKGVDYKELLDSRVGRDTTTLSSNVEVDPPEKKNGIPQGTLMEVEVLLFQFKHSGIPLSGDSNLCQCSSLGKRTLEYRSGSPTSEKEPSANRALTLSIPESMLWKERPSGGSQMLVFKASYVPKPVVKKAPVPIHLINYVSRKGCRKNVAVSVNRLNISEISQAKVGGIIGKTLVQSGNGCLSVEKSDDAASTVEEEEKVRVKGRKMPVQLNNVIKNLDSGSCSSPGKVQASAGSTSENEEPPSKINSILRSRAVPSKHHNVSAKKAPKTSKPTKRTSKEVSIMTDISFGTSVIQDSTILCQTSSPLLPPSPQCPHLHDHQYTSTSKCAPPPSASARSLNHSHPALLAKKGFADKCTSPKLTFKNGTLNGLNGYLLPEVEVIRAGTEMVGNSSMGVSNREPRMPLKLVPPVAFKKKRKINKVKKSNKKFQTNNNKYYTGSGKHGLRSFLVSLPRTHFDRLHQNSGSSETIKDCNGLPSADTASARNVQDRTQRTKRRTQVELLQHDLNSIGPKYSSDSDIPSSEEEEDLSDHFPSCSTPARWLHSSTRKITPVNHFNSPCLPSFFKKAGITLKSLRESATSALSGNIENGLPGTRKRSSSQSDSGVLSSTCVAVPPSKAPKLENETPRASSKLLDHLDQVKVMATSTKSEKVSGERCPEPQMEVVIDEEDETDKDGGQNYSDVEQQDRKGKEPQGNDQCHNHHFNGLNQLKDGHLAGKAWEGVYSGELVMFDSRGECLVKDGQYAILMQKEGMKDESTFDQLSWSSVLGQGQEETPEDSNQNVLLKFSISWSRGLPQHRLCSELRTALSLQQIRNDYFEHLPSALAPPPSLPCPMEMSSTTINCSSHELLPDKTNHTQLLSTSTITREAVEAKIPFGAMTPPVFREVPDEESSGLQCSPSSSSWLELSSRKPKIIFNYIYSESGLQKTESHSGEIVCPWCNLSCRQIYALLKHMSVCHPRFHFTYLPGSEGDHIVDVRVNKLYDVTTSSMDRDPGEWNNIALARRKNGPSRCLSCTAVFVDRHVVVKEDLSEFLNDGSWRRGYNVNRIYHHCRTCLPLLQEEMEQEKEEEKMAQQWQQISSKKMIDEFTDVNEGEKELITLWNSFMMEKKIISEKQVALACLKFAEDAGPALVEKGLVANFMAHLVNLIDYGQISPSTLKNSMRKVYKLKDGVS